MEIYTGIRSFDDALLFLGDPQMSAVASDLHLFFSHPHGNIERHAIIRARCRETIFTNVEQDDHSLRTNETTYYLVPLLSQRFINMVQLPPL